MANFMILERKHNHSSNYEVVAVTDVSDDERPILRAMALENNNLGRHKRYSTPWRWWPASQYLQEVRRGLATALVGFDIETCGAASMDVATSRRGYFQNPALLSAFIKIYCMQTRYGRIDPKCLCHIVTLHSLHPTGMCSFYLNRLVR